MRHAKRMEEDRMTLDEFTAARRTAETPSGTIAYVEHGEGPVALFVHGVFLNGYLWRDVIARLGDVRRCLAVDLLAHGATRVGPGQDLSFTAQARMLVELLDVLGIDRVDLVANDSGSGIAQLVAAHHPERLRTLTLTNGDTHDNWPPEPFKPTLAAAASGQLGPALQAMLADVAFARSAGFGSAYARPEALAPETVAAYLGPLVASPEAIHDLERFLATFDCAQTVAIHDRLRRLEVPTLIMWGTDDPFFDVKWAYWLRDTIPGARRVVEVPGGRLFFPEEEPELLASALRAHWGDAAAVPPSAAAG
jgi:pimeloyl-ACP methyl ester carboxylesterase